MATIDTSKLTEQDLDFILDALDALEEKNMATSIVFERARTMTEMMEGHMTTCDHCKDHEDTPAMLEKLQSFKQQIGVQETKETRKRKTARERITLLKARLIMLRDSKAADNLFDDARKAPKVEQDDE